MNMIERISCHRFVEIDGYAYFSNWFYNGLFKVEIKTGKTIFIGCFEKENFFEINIHAEVFRRENKIYFFPMRGSHMHIYDLLDKTIVPIEIKKKSEGSFIIHEVVLSHDFIYFISKAKTDIIKKLDLKSLDVLNENGEIEVEGKYLSEYWEIFPAPKLIEKYHIVCGDRFFWNQVSDKIWYGFQPWGRQLLRYTEGEEEIERIPLVIENKMELEKYLRIIKKEFTKTMLNAKNFWEMHLSLMEYIEIILLSKLKKRKFEKNSCFGIVIWKKLIY